MTCGLTYRKTHVPARDCFQTTRKAAKNKNGQKFIFRSAQLLKSLLEGEKNHVYSVQALPINS